MVWDRRPVTILGCCVGHQGLAHLPPHAHLPTTEVTTLRPYHHLTRLPAPLLLALLLTAVTEKELKLKQSLLCSWPSNGSHISQNQIPYKGLTSSTCPFHVSNHFFHSFKHGSSHGSLGCSWPTDTSLPQSLCSYSYSTICTHVLVTCMAHSYNSGLKCHLPRATFTDPPLPYYIPSHTHTWPTPLSWFIYLPNTYHHVFYTFHYCLSPLTAQFTPWSKESRPQSLEQYVTHRKEKVKMLVTHSCPTLCNPMDYSLTCSSVHEILQARILEWVAIPFSWGSSQPRDQTPVSCTAGRFFTPEPSGKSWHIEIAW